MAGRQDAIAGERFLFGETRAIKKRGGVRHTTAIGIVLTPVAALW